MRPCSRNNSTVPKANVAVSASGAVRGSRGSRTTHPRPEASSGSARAPHSRRTWSARTRVWIWVNTRVAAFVSMPEATMHEDDGAATAHDNVGATRQPAVMEPGPYPERAECSPDSKLGCRVPTTDSRHVGAAPGGGKPARQLASQATGPRQSRNAEYRIVPKQMQNLKNRRSLIHNAHRDSLDVAVAAAYGWPAEF